MKFLDSYFGRGIFMIYLSTIVSGNLKEGDFTKYCAIVISIILLVSGIIYMFIQCCCAKHKAVLAAQNKEAEKDDFKQSLIKKDEETPSEKKVLKRLEIIFFSLFLLEFYRKTSQSTEVSQKLIHLRRSINHKINSPSFILKTNICIVA